MKVFVYFNLHKKCWSIKALEGENKGRVIQHSDYVYIRNAKFKVSKAGRERVLKEQRKNVHAGVVGELTSINSIDINMFCGGIMNLENMVTYNPYLYDVFVDKLTGEPVYSSERVAMTQNGKVYREI